jgi:hypothetical protein
VSDEREETRPLRLPAKELLAVKLPPLATQLKPGGNSYLSLASHSCFIHNKIKPGCLKNHTNKTHFKGFQRRIKTFTD